MTDQQHISSHNTTCYDGSDMTSQSQLQRHQHNKRQHQVLSGARVCPCTKINSSAAPCALGTTAAAIATTPQRTTHTTHIVTVTDTSTHSNIPEMGIRWARRKVARQPADPPSVRKFTRLGRDNERSDTYDTQAGCAAPLGSAVGYLLDSVVGNNA